MSYAALINSALGAWFTPGQVDTPNDASGNGRHGVISNSPIYIDGLYGRAIRVGTNPSFQVNIAHALLAGLSVGTIAFRAQPAGPTTFTNPLSSYLANGDESWRFEAASPTTRLAMFSSANGWTGGNVTADGFTDAAWHSVVLTSDGTTSRAYFNNAETLNTPTLAPFIATTGGWMIGGRSPNNFRVWRGIISEVIISDYSWEPWQVEQFHVGPNVTIQPPSLLTGLTQPANTPLTQPLSA